MSQRYYECPHCHHINDHVNYTETRYEYGTASICEDYFGDESCDDSETDHTSYKCTDCEREIHFDEAQVRDSEEPEPLDINDNSENIWRVQ